MKFLIPVFVLFVTVAHLSFAVVQPTFYGGNSGVGSYKYGTVDLDQLPFTVDENGSCYYRSLDGLIEVFNAQMKWEVPSNISSEFNCRLGSVGDGINGAFGPMADTFYHALKTVEMFTHPNWGGLDKVVSTGKLTVYAHYGQRWDDAHFRSDSKILYVGDGDEKFFPLGTCLDLIAHEIAHAVIDMTSNLIYVGEAGCLGEAFADMMAQMVESYVGGTSDFLIGNKCTKTLKSIRDMSHPTWYDDYFPVCRDGSLACHEPHTCAAVPNYIFFRLATLTGWSVKLAGIAFLRANIKYWHRNITIQEAGCSVYHVVYDEKIADGNVYAVKRAWKEAGIDIEPCIRPDLAAKNIRNPPELFIPLEKIRQPNRVELLTNCGIDWYQDLYKYETRTFGIVIPSYAKGLSVKAGTKELEGELVLFFKFHDLPTTTLYDYRGQLQGGRAELLVRQIPPKTNDAFLTVQNVGTKIHEYWIYACFY